VCDAAGLLAGSMHPAGHGTLHVCGKRKALYCLVIVVATATAVQSRGMMASYTTLSDGAGPNRTSVGTVAQHVPSKQVVRWN
jgi:hypothetical protein